MSLVGLPSRPRIAVFRALQLGDMLCATPALRSLRAAVPDAHITLIGLPSVEELIRRLPHLVDDFVRFPGYPGLPEQPADTRAFAAFARAMRRRRFDLVLQLHGSGPTSNEIVATLGGTRLAGFFDGKGCPPGPGFIPWPRGHEIHRLLSLTTSLGAPPLGCRTELPVTAEDEQSLASLAAAHSLDFDRPFVCIHPGARLPSRRWPVERFAAVGQAIVDRGLGLLVTGSAAETDLGTSLADFVSPRPPVLSGKTTLGQVAALLRRAQLLVSNDTGAVHIAAAVGTRAVVVASGSDVERWRPLYPPESEVLSMDIDCRPCAHEVCPIGHLCAIGVEPSAVIAAVERALPA